MKNKKRTFLSFVLVTAILVISLIPSSAMGISMTEIKSSEALLEEVLTHPNLHDIVFFDSSETFLSVFPQKCPQLSELLNRSNSEAVIFSKYNEILSSINDSEEVSFSLKIKLLVLSALLNGEEEYSVQATDTYVTTFKGNRVYAITDSPELSNAEIYSLSALMTSNYNVTELRLPTSQYNCHSYAWYSTSANNRYWIPFPEKFLEDGTYIQNSWKVGDKIVYFDDEGTPQHSGIITARSGNTLASITVTSKWGSAGLYQHRGDECPYIDYGFDTIIVYRLCKHSTNQYTYTKSSVYSHKVSCPTCGYLKTEAHTCNSNGICTKCGERGENADINGGNGSNLE